jgi:hypothetical protein
VVIENNTTTEVKGFKALLQQLEETRVPSIRNTETRERRTVAEERWKEVVVPPHGKFEKDLSLTLPSADHLMPSISTPNVSLGYYIDLTVQMGSMFEKDLVASLSLALAPPSNLQLTADPAPPAASPRGGAPPPAASPRGAPTTESPRQTK